MNCNTLSLQDRVAKAAEVLDTKSSEDPSLKTATGFRISDALEKHLGIEMDEFGEKLIDAETTSEEMIGKALDKAFSDDPPKPARMAAAVAILKGRDPFKKPEEKTDETPSVTLDTSSATVSSGADLVVKHLEALRPIQTYKDRELLEKYVQERDYEMEQELHKRAKGQPFIVLKDGEKKEPGKEVIDVDYSMDLLKSARKGRINPTIAPYGSKVANVYRITELNLDDRKVELCPVCGETLYKGYCEKCELNFQPVGKEERSYMRLVVENSSRFQKDSFADRKALHASAVKGLDDLRATWPSMGPHFDELKATDSLPKLVLIENRPSRNVADPFHTTGNRSF
jgi:hypothetical protein